jgi:orotate phosphoribosyltransferase
MMTSSSDLREELAELLCQRSLHSGDFELASGQSASVYVDVKKTALTGRGARLVGRSLWQLAQKASDGAAGVGGLTLGADPLVTAISMAAWDDGRDLAAVIVRKETKEHGTQQYIERPDTLCKGDEIIAVDDVITTGGSTLQAIDRMRSAGFTVGHAICVVDREDAGPKSLASAGVEMHRLFTLSELLEFRGHK